MVSDTQTADVGRVVLEVLGRCETLRWQVMGHRLASTERDRLIDAWGQALVELRVARDVLRAERAITMTEEELRALLNAAAAETRRAQRRADEETCKARAQREAADRRDHNLQRLMLAALVFLLAAMVGMTIAASGRGHS